MNLEGCV